MKIGIDARFLTHPQAGGFRTYTQNLVRTLAEVDKDNFYVLYLDRPPEATTALPQQRNFSWRVVDGSAPIIGMPWREQVGLRRRAIADRLDLFHAPCLTAPLGLPCPSVVTIHDMIWRFPERFSHGAPASGKRTLMEWYYRQVPALAAQQAHAVITVSQAAKTSITQHLGVAGAKISVTYEAANAIYRPIHDADQRAIFLRNYELTPDFILALGSADPRKNMSSLLQAYARIAASQRARHPLVMVLTHDRLAADLATQVEQLQITGNVRFLSGISNDELVLLYNTAALFAFPSRYEGFGLPPLEAMACGTPVVAANNSSIPEIVGDAAVLFTADNIDELAAAITQVLNDEQLQQKLAAKGLRRAASFSWQRCAAETVAVYQQVIQRPAHNRSWIALPRDVYRLATKK